MTDIEPKSMDIDQIMKLLPHRFPFLLVDRITEYVPGVYAKGYKNISVNEPFFCGHFPNIPVMPGVLQIEALAQLSGAMVLTLPQYSDKLALFAGIDNARFKKVVRPGDKFEMSSELTKVKGPVAKAHAVGMVDGQIAVEADLIVSLIPNTMKND